MTSFALVPNSDVMLDSDGKVYGRPVRPVVNGRYQSVNFNGETHYLHRLMAEAFIPNPDGKPDVAHQDNNGLHNAVINLRWATEAENMADKLIHGTHERGERHHNAKLTNSQADQIRWYRVEGFHPRALAQMFGVSVWTIYDVCNPKRRRS